MQPLRRRAVHRHLSHERAVPGTQRRRGLRRRELHRLQGVHERLPLRRHLHQPGDGHRPQVQLLQSPHRAGSRAELRGGVPDPRHQGGRPRRPRRRDHPAHRPQRDRGAGARAEHPAQGALPGGRSGVTGPAAHRHRRRRDDLGRHHPPAPDSRCELRRRGGPHHLHHRAPDDLEGEGVQLPGHQGGRRGHDGRGRAAGAARPRCRPGRRGRRAGGDRRRVPGAHGPAAGVGPAPAGTVLLPDHPSQSPVLAGEGRCGARGVRRGVRGLVRRRHGRFGRSPAGTRRAHGAAGGGHGGLHRLPVRPVRGSRPLAVAPGAADTAGTGRCGGWGRLRRAGSGRRRARARRGAVGAAGGGSGHRCARGRRVGVPQVAPRRGCGGGHDPGSLRRRFWAGGVALGLVVPAVLVAVGLATGAGPWPAAAAGICAVVGMWFYEDSFVRAGQSVPLS